MAQIAQVEHSRRSSSALSGVLLPRAFFEQSPELVAPRLLGKLLVYRVGGVTLAGRLVEVEAYMGPHSTPPDPAAHAHRGPTPRNEVLFGPAGHAYVYAIYGRYFCLNISCERATLAGCVLLRAMEPVSGIPQMAANRGLDVDAPARMIASGPSRLCLALGITRPAHNGLDVTSSRSPLQLRDDGHHGYEVVATPRIGINPANAAVDYPLRFAAAHHPCVSGPARLRRPRP